jgi:hypothetical protein
MRHKGSGEPNVDHVLFRLREWTEPTTGWQCPQESATAIARVESEGNGKEERLRAV